MDSKCIDIVNRPAYSFCRRAERFRRIFKYMARLFLWEMLIDLKHSSIIQLISIESQLKLK